MATRSGLLVFAGCSDLRTAGSHPRQAGPAALRPDTYLRLPIHWLLALLALVVPACGAESSADPEMVVDTLAGGAVHVRHTVDLGRTGRMLDAVEALRVGAVAAGSPDAFGRIGGLAVDSAGGVYVFDAQASELRAFAADGTHRFSFGRRGAGPGEFAAVRGIGWSPTGTLWIADFGNARYTEVTRDGSLVAVRRGPVPAWPITWAGAFGRDGSLYELARRSDDPGRYVYVRHEVRDDALAAVDTFPLPAMDEPSLFLDIPAGRLRLPLPFAPRPSWAFGGDDGLWSATAEQYRIVRRTLAGDILLLLEAAHTPTPVTAADVAAARAELIAATAGANPDDIDLSAVPATKPAHGRIRVDDRARLWVPRIPAREPRGGEPPEPASFDVFDAAGRYLGAVTLDVRPDLALAFRGDFVAGVQRDAVDVEYVIVHRVGF